MTVKPSCQTCVYHHDDSWNPECRRQPPLYVDEGWSQFPKARRNDWCGEWRTTWPKEKD